jgi:hypothetical protein
MPSRSFSYSGVLFNGSNLGIGALLFFVSPYIHSDSKFEFQNGTDSGVLFL